MIHDTQSAQILQKQNERNIYAIMKGISPPCYLLSPQWLCGNSCTSAHRMMYIMVITGRTHCFHDCIYIYIYKLILICYQS